MVGVAVRVGLGVRVSFGDTSGVEVSVPPPVQAASRREPRMTKNIQIKMDFFKPGSLDCWFNLASQEDVLPFDGFGRVPNLIFSVENAENT